MTEEEVKPAESQEADDNEAARKADTPMGKKRLVGTTVVSVFAAVLLAFVFICSAISAWSLYKSIFNFITVAFFLGYFLGFALDYLVCQFVRRREADWRTTQELPLRIGFGLALLVILSKILGWVELGREAVGLSGAARSGLYIPLFKESTHALWADLVLQVITTLALFGLILTLLLILARLFREE